MDKRDNPIPFRPSAEAMLALAELLKSGKKRNAILNDAVIQAAGEIVTFELSDEACEKLSALAIERGVDEDMIVADLIMGRATPPGPIVENSVAPPVKVQPPREKLKHPSFKPEKTPLKPTVPYGSLLKGKK